MKENYERKIHEIEIELIRIENKYNASENKDELERLLTIVKDKKPFHEIGSALKEFVIMYKTVKEESQNMVNIIDESSYYYETENIETLIKACDKILRKLTNVVVENTKEE
ncbi:MAG: hypothetical protein RLZZ546_304 [Bacteroidota bacterium]